MEIREVYAGDWQALEELFGPDGADDGCWCMRWRAMRTEFAANKGEGNKQELHHLVTENQEPGLIAIDGNVAVGWVAVGPWPEYPRMAATSAFLPPTDAATWVVNCLFVRDGYRRQGISAILIDAATKSAFARGAMAVIGYPIVPGAPRIRDKSIYYGTLSAFLSAGFLPDGSSESGRLRVCRTSDI